MSSEDWKAGFCTQVVEGEINFYRRISRCPGTPGEGGTGTRGLIGNTVVRCATGDTGGSGSTGATGQTGGTGIGATGATGSSVTGQTGNTGIGTTGCTGASGNTGDTGATGFSATGETGNMGNTGDTGLIGNTGAQGITGGTGVTGRTGETGATGATGEQGLSLTGATGATGGTGGTGAPGTTGAGAIIGFASGPAITTTTIYNALSTPPYTLTGASIGYGSNSSDVPINLTINSSTLAFNEEIVIPRDCFLGNFYAYYTFSSSDVPDLTPSTTINFYAAIYIAAVPVSNIFTTTSAITMNLGGTTTSTATPILPIGTKFYNNISPIPGPIALTAGTRLLVVFYVTAQYGFVASINGFASAGVSFI